MASYIYDLAMVKVREQGLVIEVGSKGHKIQNPALVIATKQAMLMSTLATKLRLTPNSRITKWFGNTPEQKQYTTRQGLMFDPRDDTRKGNTVWDKLEE